MTDSANSAATSVAKKLARQGVFTSVMAVGTMQGAPIPSGDGFVSDGKGNIVVARLERDALQAIARAGGGRYSELTAGSTEDSPWAAVEGSEFARKEDALGERWKDTGPWLVLLLLPMVAVAFRRGLLFALPLLLIPGMLIMPDAQAGLWDDLWASRDRQAQAALEQGRTAAAASLAENPAIAGEALYRSGDFAGAGQAFSELNEADSHFNRGNSLAHAGDYDAAIEAFDTALELDPTMEDALYNRALVEEMKQMEQQQQESEGESSDEQQGEESEQGEEQSSNQQQDGEQNEQESDEQDSGEENQQSAESEMEQNWSEEDAQAMEQWLRRIPDDPGGLLRRKFRNQHQRRGAPADESEVW